MNPFTKPSGQANQFSQSSLGSAPNPFKKEGDQSKFGSSNKSPFLTGDNKDTGQNQTPQIQNKNPFAEKAKQNTTSSTSESKTNIFAKNQSGPTTSAQTGIGAKSESRTNPFSTSKTDQKDNQE